MDIRYLVVGFLSIILGFIFYIYIVFNFRYGFENFGVIVLFAIIFGVVLIVVGVVEPMKKDLE